MDIITTHLNADFDAMASMIAAHKLYPEARMVFPGSQERNLREFFLKSSLASFQFYKIRDINLDEIEKLILVDIKMKGRLGPFDEVAAKKNVELHIYDHHPRTDNDYSGSLEVIDSVGATTTLLVEEIRRRRMKVTAEEATVLSLGIYEDTGSLTFASTTPRDLDAVAYLLKKGAHLDIIPTFITRELDAEQVKLLSVLLGSMTKHDIHGVPVNIAHASTDSYIGELALLVHKMIDMENLDVLFVLVRMEDRVILVARSRLPEVDVSMAAEQFGGGGHPTAASASIRQIPLFQIREQLIDSLRVMIGQQVNARTIMSAPVIEILESAPLSEAAEIMTRYNINSLPAVNSRKSLKGIITRGVVERAINHKLSQSPVSDLMLTEFSEVSVDDPLSKVQEYIIEKRQRMLPVVKGKSVIGVITRTDLLEAMHADYKKTKPFEEGTEGEDQGEGRVRNIRELMREILNEKTYKVLSTAGNVADEMGFKAYLVGGLVRDLLLRNKNLDVDIVVEGDGIEYGRKLARRLRARIRTHKKFKTAVIIMKNGFKLDVATARTEYYESPGAHPMVESGSIKLDLYRRDFSINALAVRLDPGTMGQVVDFFGGQRDLKEKTIRILHNLSFVDDPTRMIRAVRFEQKFDFRIGKHTRYLMKGAIEKGYLPQAKGPRVHSEIMAILRDTDPLKAFDRMDELGILEALHPSLKLKKRLREIFGQVGRIHSWFQLLYAEDEPDIAVIYFYSMMLMRGEKERSEILELFHLSEQQKKQYLGRWKSISDTLRTLARSDEPRNSQIARLLDNRSTEDLLIIMSLTKRESTVRSISIYLSRLRYIKREIDGDMLKKMGYSSGPAFRKIMQAVQDAKLDGIVNSLDEEKQWIMENFPL